MAFPLAALSLVTIGAAAAFGANQYRKMNKQLPEDDSPVPAARTLQAKDTAANDSPDPAEKPPRGVAAPNPGQSTTTATA